MPALKLAFPPPLHWRQLGAFQHGFKLIYIARNR